MNGYEKVTGSCKISYILDQIFCKNGGKNMVFQSQNCQASELHLSQLTYNLRNTNCNVHWIITDITKLECLLVVVTNREDCIRKRSSELDTGLVSRRSHDFEGNIIKTFSQKEITSAKQNRERKRNSGEMVCSLV